METITIINNSGKIIRNGKHLLGLFKEAKASYQEKKAAVKADRAFRRSNTYDVAYTTEYYDEVEELHAARRRLTYDDHDGASQTSSRRSHHSRHSRRSTDRQALTESNLKTHSEVSSVAPSRAPTGLVRRSQTMHESQRHYEAPQPQPLVRRSTTKTLDRAAREREDKKIDMNLAYGSLPPDLAERVDLDPPAVHNKEPEHEAQELAEKIENLLTEAHCVHATAQHMITHLQANPEAAAAVALTLAELSALLGKMSPGFLAAIQAGSPAVFALLASPQFLIAAGVTVGMTVVMFGGWKIVKCIKDAHQEAYGAHAVPMAYPAAAPAAAAREYNGGHGGSAFDEALVLEEELSSVESWRRGIPQYGPNDDDLESVDVELITPEAMQSQYDVRSSGTSRTHKTSKTDRTEKKSHKSSSSSNRDADNASERSHRSHHTSKSRKSSVQTIEDGGRDRESTSDAAARPKKDNMLKNLFKKKKDRDERSRVGTVMSFA